MKTKKILGRGMAAMLTIASLQLFAQGVAVNTTGAPADPSAALDVSSTSQGVAGTPYDRG